MTTNTLSLRRLARFWLPLQATWLMMAVEGPFLALIIARLAEPMLNLAAFGVAYALAIVAEAPVIMMMSASTALVDCRPAYRALRRFAHTLSVAITVGMVVSLVTPTLSWVMGDLMDLDAAVVQLTHRAMWLLLPFPAAIGYRRFYQGLLIRAGLTRRVTWGTVVRLISMATAAGLSVLANLDGILVGAVALSCGVVAEAIASRIMARQVLRDLPVASPGADPADLSWHGLWRFYWPLALTSTIALAAQPVVTFFMGHARAPLESLAALPVLNGLVFIFRTPALSYQEVAIATLSEDRRHLPQVLRFAGLLAGGATLLLALVAWTPLSRVWFETVSGLSPELAAYTRVPLRVLAIMPALSVLLNLERALMVHGRHTGPVTMASVLEVTGIASSLAVGVMLLDGVGVTVAAVAYMVGRLAANLGLLGPVRGVINAKAPRA